MQPRRNMLPENNCAQSAEPLNRRLAAACSIPASYPRGIANEVRQVFTVSARPGLFDHPGQIDRLEAPDRSRHEIIDRALAFGDAGAADLMTEVRAAIGSRPGSPHPTQLRNTTQLRNE